MIDQRVDRRLPASNWICPLLYSQIAFSGMAGIISDLNRYVPDDGRATVHPILSIRVQTIMSDFIETNTSDFGWHHRFVWPALGLLMALAVWRLVVRDAMSRTGLCLYLILMLMASGFVAAAGYFGGGLLLSGGSVP